MTKAQAISLLILEKVAAGMDVKEALDEVCGEGTSAQLVSDLYDKLRS